MPRKSSVANWRKAHLKYCQELARLKNQLISQRISETEYNEQVEELKRQHNATLKFRPVKLQQNDKKKKMFSLKAKNDPMKEKDVRIAPLKREEDPLEITCTPVISENGFSLRARGNISYDMDAESDNEVADKTFKLEDDFNDDNIFEEVKKIRDNTASSLSMVIENCQDMNKFLGSYKKVSINHSLTGALDQKEQLLVVINVAEVLNQTITNFMASSIKVEQEPLNGDLKIKDIKNEHCQTNGEAENLNSIDCQTNSYDDHKFDMDEIMFENGRAEVKEEKVFYCDFCEKSFRSKYFLDKHSKSHCGEQNGINENDIKKDINDEEWNNGGKVCICEVCAKQFPNVSELRKHSYDVHQIEGFCCKDCDSTFSNKSKLKYHRKHKCNKAVKTETICQFCGLICNKSMSTHLKFCKLNTDNFKLGPFICEPCGKEYPTHKQLEVHTTNIHKKAGLCPECGEHKIDVKNHVRRVHLNEVRFTCTELDCKFTSFSKQHFKRHKKLVHENSHLNCPKCGKLVKHIYHHLKHAHKEDPDLYNQFTTKTGLFQEWSSINYNHEAYAVRGTPKISLKCDVCKKEFITKISLESHLLNHAAETQPDLEQPKDQ